MTTFGDGGQTRDFVFVGDIASVLKEPCLSECGNGHVSNSGTGVETSVRHMADTIVDLAGSSSAFRLKPPRAGDIYRSVADISVAKRLFDFRPEVSFHNGLKQTFR